MRNSHPYHTYDAIMSQPQAFIDVVQANKTLIDKTRNRISQAKRIFIVGTGTSFNAARAGQHIFATYFDIPAYTIPAFDFALYAPTLRPDDCVIVVSHRGTKRYSLKSLEIARAAKATTILITGKQEESIGQLADTIFYTVEQEISGAHTVSYTTSIGILAALATDTFDVDSMTAVLRKALKHEDAMKRLASQIVKARKIWITGGGPSEVTAQEITLKIKETSFKEAEGMGIETLLHGPFQAAQKDDFFILIAPEGKAQSRTLELIPAIEAIGGKYLLMTNDSKDDNWLEVPTAEEAYTSLSCLIPLQLLAYYIAIEKGTNPDAWRLDDPAFQAAEKFMKL